MSKDAPHISPAVVEMEAEAVMLAVGGVGLGVHWRRYRTRKFQIQTRPPARLHRPLRKGALGSLVAIVVLVAVEAVVRISGCAPEGSAPSPLLAQQIDFEPVQPGPAPGTLTFMPKGPANTSARWTTSTPARPAGLRIVTFGGSATFGLPFAPSESFSGLLQRELVALAPGQPVEVVNTGVCSLGSTGVLQVVRAVLRKGAPDLLVIYSGNNEFLDRAAIALAAQDEPPLRAWVRGPLGRLHLFRWLDAHLPHRAAPWPDGHRPFMGEVLVRPTTPDEREIVRARYYRNLSAISAMARARSIPVLLATVPTNLRDICHACGDGGLGAEEQAALDGIERAAAAGDVRGVSRLARRAGGDLEVEEGQVRLARALLAAGEAAEARRHFERAEELSGYAIRGSEVLRGVVRSVARAEGAPLCDTARAFDAAAEAGIPGRDLFLDECHPNESGHRLLARTMLDCIIRDDLLGLGAQEPSRIRAAKAVITVQEESGCPWRLDRPSALGRTPAGPADMSGDPCDLALSGHRAFMRGDGTAARRYYRAARAGGGPAGWLLLDEGLVARLDGDLPGAREALAQAAALLPDDAEVRDYLAITGGGAP